MFKYRWRLAILAFSLSQATMANQLTIIEPCGSACWSGFYIGAEAGRARHHQSYQYQNLNYFNTLGATLLGNSFDNDHTGSLGGINVGVNYQEHAWVWGLEGNVLSGMKNDFQSPFFTTDQYTAKVRWLGIAKIRFGYAYERLLFSLTAGYAGADLNLKLHDTAAGIVARGSEWSNGWTAGAGIDYLVGHHITIGLGYEYLRVRLNNKTLNCPLCGTGPGFGSPVVNERAKTQSVMARVNYYFYQ